MHRTSPLRPGNLDGVLDLRAQTFSQNRKANTRQTFHLLPLSRLLSDRIGEFSIRSELFRKFGHLRRAGTPHVIKRMHHPIVGDLDLTYQGLDLASDRGLQMLVFSAAPGSTSADGLQLLCNSHIMEAPPQE